MIEKMKQWAWPFVIGAFVMMLAMPFVFGFSSKGTVDKMIEQATEDTEDAYVAMLAPLLEPECVANAQADPDGLAAMLEKSTYSRRGVVSKAGWASYPDGANDVLKQAVDKGCAEALAQE